MKIETLGVHHGTDGHLTAVIEVLSRLAPASVGGPAGRSQPDTIDGM